MSDSQLTHGIHELLKARRIAGVHAFYVELHNGVAVIRGRVASPFAKWACYECCRRVPGVRRVVDELQSAAV